MHHNMDNGWLKCGVLSSGASRDASSSGGCLLRAGEWNRKNDTSPRLPFDTLSDIRNFRALKIYKYTKIIVGWVKIKSATHFGINNSRGEHVEAYISQFSRARYLVTNWITRDNDEENVSVSFPRFRHGVASTSSRSLVRGYYCQKHEINTRIFSTRSPRLAQETHVTLFYTVIIVLLHLYEYPAPNGIHLFRETSVCSVVRRFAHQRLLISRFNRRGISRRYFALNNLFPYLAILRLKAKSYLCRFVE